MPTKTKSALSNNPPQKEEEFSPQIPALITMLEAGVHFGHERSKKNPAMEPYIFTLRNRIAIIDLEQTREQLKRAAIFLYQLAQNQSNEILFVGTKRQARDIVKRYAEICHMPYVTRRWLGGTLTNFNTILKSIEKLDDLKKQQENPETYAKMTKKEKAVQTKEIERLENVLEGIKPLRKLPAAIMVAGSHDDELAIKEARRVGISVVALVDTNADPNLIDYPIAANDDALRSLDLLINTLSRAILKARGEELPEPAAVKAPDGEVDNDVLAENKAVVSPAAK
jgi:small subunit ribosomal protein S2